ncbi:NADH-FMN oxidoreductase RutF, flavin reductase (DIM6/NTAB) family [Chitinophaga rupis]|uniref:NADH-FMN oxidoreductase RutF, flavin reductase (DIM6/NTAB) family n=1 Tax=Chitinophaga rupis TaxID=573321 RepID=A0A1H7IZX0_9BACT|nr:flavin reductase family protein [Chitinophaga rupis]SEK66375.1 NADH-FMN oxidoreductase RutF, flavin reductase (DIM6/NTAB) family [Chitinophaga rupis]
MLSITPGQIKTGELHAYLLGAVAPRPICFASTVNEAGLPNLSPFSFFNVFGSNPPTLIFSPSRRVRDNTIKHTLENIYATKEVVINVVNYAMVQQMSLSSCEYPHGVNEFEKSGFTGLPSEKVKPLRVQESPVQLECVVREVIATGEKGGAGNLVICEPVLIHINENILNAHGQIDPHKIDLVARMGADYYCRASGPAVFEVAKPNTQLGIGVDALPFAIRNSRILTGNHLGLLANVHEMPVIDPSFEDTRLKNIIQYYSITPEEMGQELHRYAQQLLDEGKVREAWQVLLTE